MSFIPSDYHARLNRCLASGDADEAGVLITIVKAAQAAGNAMGFAGDVEKLTDIASGALGKLRKAFGGYSEAATARYAGGASAVIPAPLKARAALALHKIEGARDEAERKAATHEGERALADIAATEAIVDSLRRPQTMSPTR